MKYQGRMIVMGLMATGACAEDVGFKQQERVRMAKATDQRVELHGHVHAVSGEVPLDGPFEYSAGPTLPGGLEYGALFEWEVGHSDGETEEAMATVELGAGWQAMDWLHGDVVFLYEEGDTDPMELDQLYLTLGNTEMFPLYFQAGKIYAPFGHFDSFFISDPVVLELAESLEQSVALGFEKGGFDAGLTMFDSEVEGGSGRNAILAASYGVEKEGSSIAVGASLIHNILDADGLTGVLEDSGYTSADEAAGFNAWLTAAKGRVTLIAEYVQALERIEVDGADSGLKPSSLNLELGYELTDTIDVAAKYEHSTDICGEFAEHRFGAVCNCTLFELDLVSAGLALEYLRDEFDGGESADRVTLQLALAF
jgi:hypothetical protein